MYIFVPSFVDPQCKLYVVITDLKAYETVVGIPSLFLVPLDYVIYSAKQFRMADHLVLEYE